MAGMLYVVVSFALHHTVDGLQRIALGWLDYTGLTKDYDEALFTFANSFINFLKHASVTSHKVTSQMECGVKQGSSCSPRPA